MPAQPKQLRAALRAEVWLVHSEDSHRTKGCRRTKCRGLQKRSGLRFICETSAFFAVEELRRKGEKNPQGSTKRCPPRQLRKQLKRFRTRPKMAGGFVEIVEKPAGFLKIWMCKSDITQLQKVLLAGILSTLRTKPLFHNEAIIFA
jgi:hypothetical protein